jgi:hypothetical protein
MSAIISTEMDFGPIFFSPLDVYASFSRKLATLNGKTYAPE